MPKQLRISIRFLGGAFHGRGEGGDPEWPPSPLRLFQAIVAGAAERWAPNGRALYASDALRWLEQLPPPQIISTELSSIQPKGYKTFVPNNQGDLVAGAWSRGNDAASIAEHRAEKFIRPKRFAESGDKDVESAIHYLWKIEGSFEQISPEQQAILISAVHSVSRLGWGIDLVVADAEFSDGSPKEDYSGERWLPVDAAGGNSLRAPINGTFDALEERFSAFLNRIQRDENGREVFNPVPPLSTFLSITYRRESEIARPPYAVFALREPDDSRFAAFDTKWRRLHLSGMLRHMASQPKFASAMGWNSDRVRTFVQGHSKGDNGQNNRSENCARLLFIPLPSIEWRGEKNGNTVGLIRRVLVTATLGENPCSNSEFDRLRRIMEGRELIDEKAGKVVAFLRQQSSDDKAVSAYFKDCSEWVTVTPVILPGHDDPKQIRRRLVDREKLLSSEEKARLLSKLDARTDLLLRKALREAGFSPELVAHAELQWRSSGFLPGADLVSQYSVPDHCRGFRRLHVRIHWRSQQPDGTFSSQKISGPFCIGRGKFSGLGLFVPVEE